MIEKGFMVLFKAFDDCFKNAESWKMKDGEKRQKMLKMLPQLQKKKKDR